MTHSPDRDPPGDGLDGGTDPVEPYRAIFESSLNGIALHEIVTDHDGEPIDYVFLEVNPGFEQIVEIQASKLIGNRVTEVFPGIEDEPWIETYGRVALTGEPTQFDQYSETLQKHFEVHAFSPCERQFVVVFHDVTALVAARQALSHSETMRRSVTASSTDYIMLVDLEATIRYVNRTVGGLAVEQVVGTSIYDHVAPRWHGDMAECFRGVIETGEPGRYFVEYDYPDGGIGYFESRVGPVIEQGAVVALAVSATDRTEHRELEDRLRQSQKMEAIGRLAGGVAHDFNNLLTGIKGFCHLALSRETGNDELAEELHHISALADQASDLTGQLLAFSRRQPIRPTVLNLSTLVEGTTGMLKRLLPENVLLEVSTSEKICNVRADRGQIQQVLMNLAVNARDAMKDGGTITVSTSTVGCDEDPCGLASGAVRCAKLSVSDTGPGIDPETEHHIFEPFFTTKRAGRGTGLGLATVYGIVRQHEGHVELESEPGRGACFDVYLPAVDEEVEPETTPAEESAATRGTETVLLVEDEDAVREVASRILTARGYRVIEAADTAEATELFSSHSVDLLISDVIMPGGNGPALYRTLSGADPSLKVIYMSGYVDRDEIGDVSSLGAPFLRKPFEAEDLVTIVRESLDVGGN